MKNKINLINILVRKDAVIDDKGATKRKIVNGIFDKIPLIEKSYHTSKDRSMHIYNYDLFCKVCEVKFYPTNRAAHLRSLKHKKTLGTVEIVEQAIGKPDIRS